MADNFARREWLHVPDKANFDRYFEQSVNDCVKAGIKPYSPDQYNFTVSDSPCRIRPSIHMPRWASRISLEITGVRVERLQDISEADALEEGVDLSTKHVYQTRHSQSRQLLLADSTAKRAYERLWESINGPSSWAANPWVWVIEFKVIK